MPLTDIGSYHLIRIKSNNQLYINICSCSVLNGWVCDVIGFDLAMTEFFIFLAISECMFGLRVSVTQVNRQQIRLIAA